MVTWCASICRVRGLHFGLRDNENAWPPRPAKSSIATRTHGQDLFVLAVFATTTTAWGLFRTRPDHADNEAGLQEMKGVHPRIRQCGARPVPAKGFRQISLPWLAA